MGLFKGLSAWLHKHTPGEQQADLFARPGDPVREWFAFEPLETNPERSVTYEWSDKDYRGWADLHQAQIDVDFFADVGILLESQETKSFEDQLNAKRLQSLRERFSHRLMGALMDGDFEYGYESEADRIVASALKENVLATKSWLGELFRQHFGDVTIVTGLLHVFSRIDHKVIEPEGEIFATAAIAHQNILVRECAIRCFEAWSQPSSISILENLELHEKWLDKYRLRVLADIRDEVCSFS